MAELREALDRHEGWAREGEDVFVEKLAGYLRARMPERAAEGYSFITLARPSGAGLGAGWRNSRRGPPSRAPLGVRARAPGRIRIGLQRLR